MKLLAHQERHIESIKWLIHPIKHLGEGRTYTLAAAVLEVAIEEPGRTIYFREFIHPAVREHFVAILKQMARENYPKYYFWFQKMSIKTLSEKEYLFRMENIRKFGKQ